MGSGPRIPAELKLYLYLFWKPTAEHGFWRESFVEGWVKNALGMFKFRLEHPHTADPCGLNRERGEEAGALIC